MKLRSLKNSMAGGSICLIPQKIIVKAISWETEIVLGLLGLKGFNSTSHLYNTVIFRVCNSQNPFLLFETVA